MTSVLKPQNPSEFPQGTAYQVTSSERDNLKKNHPAEYANMLELVISGRVVIVKDADVR